MSRLGKISLFFILSYFGSPQEIFCQTSNNRFYIDLHQATSLINDTLDKIEEAQQKADYFRDAYYMISSKKPEKRDLHKLITEGTIISEVAKELYDEYERQMKNTHLPEIPPPTSPVVQMNASHEERDRYLSKLTEEAQIYHSILNDYYMGVKQIDALIQRAHILKLNNKSVAELLEKLSRNPAVHAIAKGLPYDWYKFEFIFRSQIGKIESDLKTKKKRYTSHLDTRITEFEDHKKKILILIHSEQKNLELRIEEHKRTVQEYTNNSRQIEDKIEARKRMKSSISKIEISILQNEKNIKNTNNGIRSLRKKRNKARKKRAKVIDDKYIRTYKYCENTPKAPYHKCTHTKQKERFDKERAGLINSYNSEITNYESHIRLGLNSIKSHQKSIQEKREEIKRLSNLVKEIPRLEKERESLIREFNEEYMEDIFNDYTTKFIDRATRNIKILTSLPDIR